MLHRNKINETEVPFLQYMKGSTLLRHRRNGVDGSGLAGFLAEAERYGDEFDQACLRCQFELVEIRHSFGREKPKIVKYWYFGQDIGFYPLTTGPVADNFFALLRKQERAAEAGIGIRWDEQTPERKGGSAMALRGYEHTLMTTGGYDKPVQFGLRGPFTNYLMDALVEHVRAAEAADELARQKGNPDAYVGLVELCWPLQVSGELIAVGKAQTSEVMPFVCAHPGDLTRDYLKSIYASGPLREKLVAAVVRDWPSTQAWAEEFNAGAGAGEPGPKEAQADTDTGELARAQSNGWHVQTEETDDDIPF